MRKLWSFTLLLMFTVSAVQSFAACHAVGPTAAGDGSGSDWANRMNRLPSTLVRGDIYYLMDGTYSTYKFSTANSGTSVITVKKAQSYDYGRSSDGCSNDISAGWNAATMGSGQAKFTEITATLGIDYIRLDGNGRYTGQGCGTAPGSTKTASDCGIYLGPISTGCSSECAYLYLGSWSGGNTRNENWTIRYIEGQGAGDSWSGSGSDEITIRDGTSNMLMDHMYLHDAGCDFFKIPTITNLTVQNSYFWKNDSNASCHGQMIEVEVNSNGVDWHNNVFRAIKSGSTAVFTANTGSQSQNWNIYNNIFTQLDVSNGIFACINSGSRCTNINFYGNTLVTGSRTNPSLIYSENTGSTYTVRNTLAYNYNGLTIQGGPGSATVTQDHNTWLNSGSPGGGTGTITVTSGAPNPFVDYAGLDYRLASNNANWNNGTALASPFNMDAAGNARPGADGIWNTGALQFSSDTRAQAPASPTGLTASVE